jgi:putative membrane protein insertion efficiency factor
MKKLTLLLLKKYQTFSSFQKYLGVSCRFYPTCSDYTYEAVEKYGVGKGLLLGLLRVMRCNPWNKGGIDKVN